jgi:mRNA interferase RelE/StbE
VIRAVIWTPRALRELRALDQRVVQRIGSAVTRYAETGHGDAKKLEGRADEYRLRVGAWRVIFAFGTDPGSGGPTIDVLRVVARGRAYRD